MNNKIIEYFEKEYNLEWNNNKWNLNDITFLCHKDKVWFFIINKIEDIYVLLIYWNIPEKSVLNLKNLYSKINWIIEIEIIEKYWKYLFMKTNKYLEIEDFLMYKPNYYIKDNFLYWPYLDNLISKYIFDNSFSKYGLYQSFDEESKMIYSKIPKSKYYFILDTIWQDFLKDKINYNKIYNISSTLFSKQLQSVNHRNIINMKIDFSFKMEVDIVKSSNVIYLLCPIENWHNENSRINLDTLNLFSKVINDLLLKIWKKY